MAAGRFSSIGGNSGPSASTKQQWPKLRQMNPQSHSNPNGDLRSTEISPDHPGTSENKIDRYKATCEASNGFPWFPGPQEFPHFNGAQVELQDLRLRNAALAALGRGLRWAEALALLPLQPAASSDLVPFGHGCHGK